MTNVKERKEKNVKGCKFAGTGIHGYGYYDIRTRLVNMRVSKIPIPAGSGYPVLISVFICCRFYPRILADTNFFDIPNHG